MGSVPAKMFTPSAPYGSSEGVNALNPSQPSAANPQTPLLPSNFQDPGVMQTQNLNPVTASSQVQSRNPFGGGKQGSPLMRGMFGALLFLLLALPVWSTTTITGHIADLGTISQTGNTFVRFSLRGCGGGQPRALGVALIAPSQGAAWFKDFAANAGGNVSGTIYSTRDATGLLGGEIDCNGSLTAVWYGMTIWQGGKSGPEIPVHAINGGTLNVSSVTPITFNPVVTAPTGDTTYCRLDAGNGYCPQLTTTTGSWIIKGPNPWVDLMAFGAVCDGVTDDSVALQTAGNFAISAGGILKLPPLQCAFSVGMVFTQAIQIEGAVEQGGAGFAPVSRLLYTGFGNAITINNGTSYIYGVHLRNFELVGKSNVNQGEGVICSYCNQLTIDSVFVLGFANPVSWATAFDFNNTAGIVSHNMLDGQGTVGVNLVNATNVDIDGCQLYSNNIVFLMGGNNVGIDVHDCPNIERQDYLVDWDDTNPSAAITFGDNVNFHNNYIIFDGGAATYPHQQVLHVSNTGTNEVLLRNLIFSDNEIVCPAGTCSSTYPFNIAISGTTNAATAVTMTAERNWMCCFASGGITANSTKATVAWVNNQNLSSLGTPTLTDTNGTANYCVIKYAAATASVCALSAPSVTATGAVSGATVSTSGLASLASLAINSDTTMTAAPRMFISFLVPTVTTFPTTWLNIPSIGKPITIIRIGLVALTQSTGCTTTPQFGIQGTSAFLALPNGTTFVDSGVISVSVSGLLAIGVLNTDAGCAPQATNVAVSIEYVMQ